MTHSRHALKRALLPILATVMTAGPLLALPSSSAAPGAATAAHRAASKPARTLFNETFEYGTRGWETSSRAQLTTVADGRRSRRAARLQARTPGLVVAASTAHARDLEGSRHAVTAWLRSPGGRVTARLVVREVEPATGEVLATRRDKVRVGRAWAPARVKVTRTSGSSVVRVEVRTHQSRKDRVLLDDVQVLRIKRALKQGKKKRPTATPTPTPTPTATPTASPLDVAGTLSNGCTYSSRGIPSCGAYVGSAYGANSDVAPMEAATGQRLGIRRTYYQGHQVDSAVRRAQEDIAAGRLPWISFKLPLSWEEMAAGKGDAWALDLANKLKTVGGPVWVAFHHEPEKDGDIKAWTAMQERLGPIVRHAAANVAFTVITTGWNQLYGPAEYRLESLWPRTTVDVAGFDVYNWHMTKRSNGTLVTKTEDMRTTYFDKFAAWAKANNTTWALAETGLTDEAHAADPAWIERTYQQLVETGGLAMTYFNTELNSYGNSYPITTPQKYAGFAAAQRNAPLLPRP
ncbi:carbohydrate-binding protein CenC [Nocardioides solisilvae]|uniref:carbohydrate-binding protein CenC n=1 Tax=Nocardioides solisilvae TaxID=1542435 RepID=UPI000D74220A|nr:carbohydrate-binding protein CenC [Nocardioides solisilvae]